MEVRAEIKIRHDTEGAETESKAERGDRRETDRAVAM